MTYDQRDTDRWDDPDASAGWPAISSYDMGFDDAAVNQVDPVHPEDKESMQGYRDGGDSPSPMNPGRGYW